MRLLRQCWIQFSKHCFHPLQCARGSGPHCLHVNLSKIPALPSRIFNFVEEKDEYTISLVQAKTGKC